MMKECRRMERKKIGQREKEIVETGKGVCP